MLLGLYSLYSPCAFAARELQQNSKIMLPTSGSIHLFVVRSSEQSLHSEGLVAPRGQIIEASFGACSLVEGFWEAGAAKHPRREQTNPTT
jgi:hypothetical protein